MKLSTMLLTGLVLLGTLVARDSEATQRRPDILMKLINNSNHEVTFYADTYCANGYGTIVVPAKSRVETWYEGRHSEACYFYRKEVTFTIKGYNHTRVIVTAEGKGMYNDMWRPTSVHTDYDVITQNWWRIGEPG